MPDLLWGTNKPKTKGPKPNLHLKAIVAEAVRIADTEGLAALSMNSLARRLNVGTMSLYRHVPNKDELITLMIDTAMEVPPDAATAPGRTWRQAMRRWAVMTMEIFERHPWLLPLIAGPRRMGPNELAWGEIAMRAAHDAGATSPQLYPIVMLLNSFVRGFAQMSAQPGQGGPGVDLGAIGRSGNLDRYPMLLAALGVSESQPVWDGRPDGMFEFGLERVLDGIELHLKGER